MNRSRTGSQTIRSWHLLCTRTQEVPVGLEACSPERGCPAFEHAIYSFSGDRGTMCISWEAFFSTRNTQVYTKQLLVKCSNYQWETWIRAVCFRFVVRKLKRSGEGVPPLHIHFCILFGLRLLSLSLSAKHALHSETFFLCVFFFISASCLFFAVFRSLFSGFCWFQRLLAHLHCILNWFGCEQSS